jgi:hypothetical protein
VFFVVFAVHLGRENLPAGFSSIYVTPADVGLLPAGQLVPGAYFEYAIDWSLATENSRLNARQACVSLLMGNYDNQNNHGSFRVVMRVDGLSYVVTEKAKNIRNNMYHYFCFEGLAIEDILQKPVTVVLEGVDSRAGGAVTGYLATGNSGSTLYGSRDIDNGNLVLQIGAYSERLRAGIYNAVLILLCGLSGVALFWPTRS